ncbi:MAG: chemotaxis protein CheA, partial [Acidocella sp.]|nr:chemotaxis protein CheA [Acidocella sp.]
MDSMAAIRETFFQECEEQLAGLEAGLIMMEEGTADSETVNAVFRSVHSIKGGAGIFALDALVRFAHVFETALDSVRSGQLDPGPAVLNLLLRAADVLADLVRAAREGGAVDEARTAALAAEFSQINQAGHAPAAAPAPVKPAAAAAKSPGPTAWDIVFTPKAALYAKANETAIILRELGRLGPVSVVLDDSELPDLAAMEPEGAYLTWRIRLDADCTEAALREVFEFVEDDCALAITQANGAAPDEPSEPTLQPGDTISGANGFSFEFFPPVMPEDEEVVDVAPPPPPEPARQPPEPARKPAAEPVTAKAEAAAAVSATIRVDLDRVDRMIDLVGELVINEAMLSQRVLEAGINRASGVAMALEELEHLTREIQDSVMAIRAQPVRSVFQRMPRLVREVAAQTGKQVRLVTEGEGTEVDKTVIERIADPLTHMIRNAIDHGLEKPDIRVARGKPAEGLVRLNALHRSGRIVLEVADDGAGINRERVKEKAIENGLIPPDAQLSDEE